MQRSTAILPLQTGKTLGRPKVRSDAEQRDIIVRKALDLFLDVGFAAMKMDGISAECKISKRTLYRLFPSKLDLFKAMVEMHRESMLTFPETLAMMPLEEALAEIFRIDLGSVEDCRRAAFIDRTVAEAKAVPELGSILHHEGGEKAKVLLAAWFNERNRDGTLRIGNPYSAASILMDMVFGAIAFKPTEVAYWPGGVDRKTYLRECIRYFVNGVK